MITWKNKDIECGSGWHPLVLALIMELNPLYKDLDAKIYVKEKFGTLRFYIIPFLEDTLKIVAEFEKLSESICENCGKEGKIRNDLGWILTLCEEHYKEALKNGRKKM